MDRRKFLTTVVVAFQADAIARAQSTADSASGRPADAVARDEDFWFDIRHAFTVDRNIINLNNGGVSPAPKVVMDTEIRLLEMENMNAGYYMWRILFYRPDKTRPNESVPGQLFIVRELSVSWADSKLCRLT